MDFYSALDTVCKKKGTTPWAVLKELGMSKSNVTSWKDGRSPRLDVVTKIADHLGVSAASLIRVMEKEKKEEQTWK